MSSEHPQPERSGPADGSNEVARSEQAAGQQSAEHAAAAERPVPWPDLRGRAVLITGGTRGIGLATGLAFARHGAHVTLTSKWGSADEEAIRRTFAAAAAHPPEIVQGDAGHDADVEDVLRGIRRRHDQLYAIISNAAFGAITPTLEAYSRRALQTTIDYTAWPLVTHTLLARRIFERSPRYVIGLSSEGADSMHPRYDLVAAAKSVLETLCRYLHYRLQAEGTRVNIVRTRYVDTPSLAASLGDDFAAFVARFEPDILITPEEVADAILGLCSGAMDAVGGQIVTVDRGAGLYDNFSRLYQERDRHPIPVTTKEQK